MCPAFGPPLIRRILNSFVPDEFCPDPIPGVVIEALNSEVSTFFFIIIVTDAFMDGVISINDTNEIVFL